MITVRKSQERGHVQEDWLDSRHTFSFGEYHDPGHMGFRALRVINEDRVQPGRGFPLHPHHDMEIITFIIEGMLEHRDDMGNRETIRAGEIQRITAGAGIRHSEANPSDHEPVHLLQIWIFPEKKGLPPGYEMKRFASAPGNELSLLISRDGRKGSALLHQDAAVYFAKLEAGRNLEWSLPTGRHAWLQVIDGSLDLNGTRLESGDGAAVSDEEMLKLAGREASRFILFDLQ
jgi:redox-sensitive bicupin YhaK (pirin superfamily)